MGSVRVLCGPQGEEYDNLLGNLFFEDSDDQTCVDTCPCQRRLFGWQLVEPGQAFEPLESEFDLITKEIEGEDIDGRESIGEQRGQQKNVLGCLQAAGVGLLAAFLGVFEQEFALVFRGYASSRIKRRNQMLRGLRYAFMDTNLHSPSCHLSGSAANRSKGSPLGCNERNEFQRSAR